MAVETYSWRSQLGAGAIEYSQTVRAAQFGDGYEQVADNGINSTAIQVPMKHTGTETEVDSIRDFLLAHTVKAFIITPPGVRITTGSPFAEVGGGVLGMIGDGAGWACAEIIAPATSAVMTILKRSIALPFNSVDNLSGIKIRPKGRRFVL